MKAFTATSTGLISTGIATSGGYVNLGEGGRGRLSTQVKVEDLGPIIQDGKLLDAGIRQATVGQEKVFTLIAPRVDDNRALVRINTGASYTRNVDGYVMAYLVGQPVYLTKGYGAFGDAGRLGTWDDALWVMNPGDVLFVRPSGKNSSFILSWNGERLTTMTVDRFFAEMVPAWITTATAEQLATKVAELQKIEYRTRPQDRLLEALTLGVMEEEL